MQSKLGKKNNLILSLNEYLRGDEWKMQIDIFINSNCHFFADIVTFSHEQFDLWKIYQEICEQILDITLQTVGDGYDNIESLEKIMDEIADEPAKGPRDAETKQLLQQLLTFHDFGEFSRMMNQEAAIRDHRRSSLSSREIESPSQRNAMTEAFDSSKSRTQLSERSTYKIDLLTLGFTESLIDMVLDGYTQESLVEFDELVATLSDMNADMNNSTYSPHNVNATDRDLNYDGVSNESIR